MKKVYDRRKCDNCVIKKENDELWDRLDQAIAQLAEICINPFSLNFDKPKTDKEGPAGVPGHQRRTNRRRTDRKDKDRRK